MKGTLFLIGLGTAAVYFLDNKKGKKRRAEFSKNFRNAVDQVEEYCAELVERSKPALKKLSEEGMPYLQSIGRESQKYATQAGTALRDYSRDGGSKWRPSARMTGAAAGALALYGTGRRGLTGALIRTLSLGFFTRALLAGR
jgi:hypothetical protein